MSDDIKALLAWASGDENHHNADGSCLPDFSCCLADEAKITVEAELKARYLKAFAESDFKVMFEIRKMFYTEIQLPDIIKFENEIQTLQ